MKTIYVSAKTTVEAKERSQWLYMILRNCTNVSADLVAYRAEVRTKTTVVRYIPEDGRRTDGIRCDIPCGFGKLGKIMARGKEYKELNSEQEIAEYIEKMEEQDNE